MPPNVARAKARARFGSMTVVADDLPRRARDRLRRQYRPRRSLCVALVQARAAGRLYDRGDGRIGLGVVAVLFTFLNVFLFRVDTVPDIGEMYAVERPRLADGDRSPFTRPQFEALRSETSVFTDAYAALSDIDLRVDGRMMSVTLVTGNFFHVVGVNPVMGAPSLPPMTSRRQSGARAERPGLEPPLQSRSQRGRRTCSSAARRSRSSA